MRELGSGLSSRVFNLPLDFLNWYQSQVSCLSLYFCHRFKIKIRAYLDVYQLRSKVLQLDGTELNSVSTSLETATFIPKMPFLNLVNRGFEITSI